MGAIDLEGTSTRALVSDRFDLSEQYATTTFEVALGYLAQTDDISASLDWTPPSINSGTPLPPGLSGLLPVVPGSPNVGEVDVSTVDFTHQQPVQTSYDVTSRDVPEFNVTLPDFYIPAPPTTTVPIFTHSAPQSTGINIPTDDIPNLPAVPKLKEILAVEDQEFQLPEFAAIAPSDDMTPPEDVFSWNEAEYNSDVATALKQKIIDGIINGGQGMLPEVESAIYDRAKSRLEAEAQNNELLAINDFSSRGSRLPPGALIARLNEIRRQNLIAANDLNRDIVIKSADLAFQYSTFIIEKGISLEHEYMTIFNNIQQRSFEASKLVVDFAIQQYGLKVQAFSARLEKYRTEAEIYKARIQAEVARAELFKTTIESRKLSLEMQGLMVDLYSKQVAAIDTMAKIYATKMDAARTQAEIDGIAVERFRALVDAYKAEVEGVTAEYNLYQARIVGESEKANMYAKQVDGYKSTVEAYKARTDMDISVLRAKLEKDQGQINIFQSLVEKYKADIQNNIATADIQARAEGLKIQVFDGEVRKFSAMVSAMVESYRVESTTGIAEAEMQVKYGEMLSRIEVAEAEIRAELVKAKAQIASQMSAAALTSVSAGAHVGFSGSASESSSSSVSSTTSSSDSTSTSTSTIINQ